MISNKAKGIFCKTKIWYNNIGLYTTYLRDSRYHEPEYDLVVVGGGIIGAASARELLLQYPQLKVALVEKENKLALHQSGYNSGVMHTGIYYKPGSLKAQLCVEGLQLLYEYCDKEGVPYKKVGKLIVATTPQEVSQLNQLYNRAIQNGVKDIKEIDESQIKEYEPYCKGLKALWSPHTGITDYSVVTNSYVQNFTKLGGSVHLGFEVTDFRLCAESQIGSISGMKYPFRIISRNSAIRCGYVLTCAGLYSDRVSGLSGCSGDPIVVPFRGEYLLLKPEKTHMVRGNIYPVPKPELPFLGVHFTPRINGDVWIGPNAVLAFKREGYRWSDFSLGDIWSTFSHQGFQKLAKKYMTVGAGEVVRSICPVLQISAVRKLMPHLKPADVIKGPTGVRAQAMSSDGSLVDDFVFSRETSNEISTRVLHCRNAPSPAATSSLAIARMIVEKCKLEFGL